MKPELKAFVLITIFALLVFALLAVYFNHWWIALFGLLLSVSYHEDKDGKDDNKGENHDNR